MANPEREPDPHGPIGSEDGLALAQRNAARQRYGNSGALQDIINTMMADQEKAIRANAAKASEMGVDVDTVVKKWASKHLSVFPNGTPLPVTWPASNPTATVRGTGLSPGARGQIDDVIMSGQESGTSPETDAHVDYSSTAPMDVTSPESGVWTGGSSTPNESEMSDNQLRNGKTGNQLPIRRPSLKMNIGGSTKEKRKQKRVTFSENMPIPTLLPATLPVAKPSKMSAARAPPGVEHTPSLFVRQVDRYPVKPLPKWYEGIKPNNLEMVKLKKKRPQALASLEALKNCIGRCEETTLRSNVKPTNPKVLELFDELRNLVHKAEIYLPVDRYIVRSARILHLENGLPRIFQEDAQFPSDLKADSYQLYLRWMREDFEQNVLRGIITVKGPNRGSDRLDPTYRSKHPTTAKYYGDKGLIIGQCWPSQLCTVRDGAHGSSQGGIFGDKDKGAYSIVLSGGGGYKDQDNGDSVVYSGTDGQDFTATEATQQMLRSAELGNEIRVIRSANLHRDNRYRPVIGFRYDGLYMIKGFELVDKKKQIHRFMLERCSGQDEIRCGDNAASRPTQYEIDEYKSLKVKHRWA